MKEKWLKKISSCVLFKNINEEQLDSMLSCLDPDVREYKKNEYITLAGEKYKGVGVVLSGEVVITKENASGNRVIMEILGPGGMFGEMIAFAGGNLWPATVIAQKECRVMFLPPDKIVGSCGNSCASHQQLIRNMLKIISQKALMLNRKVEYLSIRTMRGKISNFLLEQYKKNKKTTFMLPLKRNELAEFLNVSRPSLSREMCRMRDEGIIDFHRSSIQIKDLDALKEMVD
ncbi:MAG TPA: Crp/Fnr family transcriptional regulator [Clostridia bacterium]|nr:Crp/Fnr family transcriptional regulator [Clostridia bacterium]